MQETHSQRVAGAVRAELARRRMNQEHLAAALGVSQAAVSRRLTGATAFRVDELEVVARTLDVPLSTLLPEPERAAS